MLRKLLFLLLSFFVTTVGVVFAYLWTMMADAWYQRMLEFQGKEHDRFKAPMPQLDSLEEVITTAVGLLLFAVVCIYFIKIGARMFHRARKMNSLSEQE